MATVISRRSGARTTQINELGLYGVRGPVLGSGPAFRPDMLFANGEQGAWYDPSDLSTLFQDAAGTTPVTADGDPVGLLLDKSRGLELGPNLADTFDLSAFAIKSRVQNVSADSFEVADGETDGGVAGRLGESGKRYTAVVHYTRLTPGDIALTVGSASTAAEQVRETMAASGTITATRNADTINTLFIRLYGSGASVRIDAIELREVKGNHASQAVSASRPVYRTDGALHWLEGITSWMQSPVFTMAEHWFVSYAIAQNIYRKYHGPWRFLREGGDPSANMDNRLEDYTTETATRAVYARYGSSGRDSSRGSVLPVATTRYVGWAGYNPEASHHVGEQWGGVDQQVVVPDLARSPGTGSISLFRAYRGDIMPGKMFGFCFRTGAPTSDRDREFLNAYMRARGGIQL